MAEVFFPVMLTPDERNAGAFCYGFDLMIYGGDVFSVKFDQMNGTPAFILLIYDGGVFFPSS